MVKNEKKKTRISGSSSSKKPKQASKIAATTPKSNGIEMSKQLLRSIQKPRPRANRSCDKRKSMEIICGKQHMPPLSELEKMYEESDDEIGESSSIDCKSHMTSSDEILPSTPISPTSVKNYANNILRILNRNKALSPDIPMKTSKKSKVPYKVNSKRNPRVQGNRNPNVFKDDITNKTNSISTDGTGFNCSELSKPDLNAQANEIASKLLVTKHKPICDSSDSDDTVVYELDTPLSRFSPQPSTSKDSETISKNDERFHESFMARNKYNNAVNNRVEHDSKISIVNKGELVNERMKDLIASEPAISMSNMTQANKDSLSSEKCHDIVNFTDLPCETIVIDDDDDDYDTYNMDVQTKANKCIKRDTNNLDTEIETSDRECVIIDKISNNIKCIDNVKDNKCININNSPIIVEDVFDPHIIAEIDLTNINVDDVITQNKSIIDKYSKHNSLNTVQDDISDKLEHIMKQFFDNIENIVLPNQAYKAIKDLSSHERIQPQCTLNNSVNSLSSQTNLSQNVESNRKTLLGPCPICLENLSKEMVGSTNCGHLFCMPCIIKALKTKPKKCPTCRKKLTGTGYHQIFM